jgi:hypothetical protein
MKIIFACALTLFVLANGYNLSALAQQNKYAVAGIDDAETADKFFVDLKTAVEKNERQKVAALIDYPINVLLRGRRLKLRNKAELLKNYDAVFNGKVRQALAKSTAPSFANYQGVMIGDGEIWFNLIKDKLKITAINN